MCPVHPGCTTVICSDKTGTLTTNQMTVVKVAVVQSPSAQITEYDVTGATFESHSRFVTEKHATYVASIGVRLSKRIIL